MCGAGGGGARGGVPRRSVGLECVPGSPPRGGEFEADLAFARLKYKNLGAAICC